MSATEGEPEASTGSSPDTPAGWVKSACGIPLFAFSALLMGATHIIPKFDAMFAEMDLGELPVLTRALLLPSRYGLYHPLVVLLLIAAVAIVHFQWAGRTFRRLVWFDLSVLFLISVFLAMVMIGLLVPLSSVMERIGK